MWIVQAVVGLALTSMASWATWASVATWKHETRLAVVETRTDGIDKSLTEIKASQSEINHKLDRLIERRGR
jgi:hypothetical protein